MYENVDVFTRLLINPEDGIFANGSGKILISFFSLPFFLLSFKAHHYSFCSCKSYPIGLILSPFFKHNFDRVVTLWKFWRGRNVCLDFYKLCSYFLMKSLLFLCSFSLCFKDSIMTGSHSLVSPKKALSGFSKSWPELLNEVQLMTANKNCLWVGTKDNLLFLLRFNLLLLFWFTIHSRIAGRENLIFRS